MKFLDELFIGLGKDKIVLKDLKENPLEHLTMLFGKSGELDVHRTTEGSTKEYESLAKVNLEKLIQDMLASGLTEEKFVQELSSDLVKVDFTEREFSDCKIISQKSKETLSDHMIKNKKKAVLTSESIKDMNIDELLIPWDQGKQHVLDNCIVVKNNEMIGAVFRKENDYFFFSLQSFLENSFGKEIQNMLSDKLKPE